MKIGIIDDGVDATHTVLRPDRLRYPAGFPKGQTQFTTPKVIVQRTFAPASPAYKFATVPFDPSDGSFHATHVARDRRRRPQHAGRHPAPLGRRAERVPRQLQGADDPDARLRPRRQLGRDRRRDRGGRRRRDERDQPLARRARGRADARLRRRTRSTAPPRPASCRSSPPDNDFDQIRLRLGQLARRTPRRRSRSPRRPRRTTIADFSSAGPTPVSLQLKPDVSAPGVGDHLLAADDQGGPFGRRSRARAWRRPQVAGGAALLKQRASRLDGRADQVGARPDRRPGARPGRPRGVGAPRGRRPDQPAARRRTRCSSPRRPSIAFPVNGGSRTVALDRRGRRRRHLDGDDRSCRARTATSRSRPPADGRRCPGSSPSARPSRRRRQPATSPASSSSRTAPTRAASRSGSTSTTRCSPREPVDALTRPGIYNGHDARAAEARVSRYRYPTGGDTALSGPGGRLPRAAHEARRELRRRVTLSGNAVPHVVFAGDENHLVGYRRPADQRSTRTSTASATSASGRRRRPPGPRHLRHRLRHALGKSLAGPFTVPLLGQRHDAADAPAAAERAGHDRGRDHRRRLGSRPAVDHGDDRRPRRPRALRRRQG